MMPCHFGNPQDSFAQEQMGDYLSELARTDEILRSIEKDIEETGVKTEKLRNQVSSLNKASNVALAVMGVVAFYVLEGSVQYVKTRYFT